MIGKKYGNMTVLELEGRDKYKRLLYRCRCDCGNEKVVLGASLRDGHTTSCGCRRKELMTSEFNQRKAIRQSYFWNVAHNVDDICLFKDVLSEFVNDPAEWRLLIKLRDKIIQASRRQTAEKFSIATEEV